MSDLIELLKYGDEYGDKTQEHRDDAAARIIELEKALSVIREMQNKCDSWTLAVPISKIINRVLPEESK